MSRSITPDDAITFKGLAFCVAVLAVLFASGIWNTNEAAGIAIAVSGASLALFLWAVAAILTAIRRVELSVLHAPRPGEGQRER